jgi:phenylpyruvate tautomerase PptA (4-oxalocrotonate tautomerase family)
MNMPWVNAYLNRELSSKEQELVKSGLAEILWDVLAKEERGLYVTFSSTAGTYRAGEKCHDGAVINIKYIGNFPLANKQEITRRICGFMSQHLALDPARIIVPFDEMVSENWGRREGNYS